MSEQPSASLTPSGPPPVAPRPFSSRRVADEPRPPSRLPRTVLDSLTPAECLELLRRHEFGRLAMNVDGDPVIFPVNYVLDGDTVAVRTDPGSGIEASIMERVAFEVDHVDAESREGWSVVVRGVARQITDAIDASSKHTRSLPLVPWAPGLKPEWIKIMDATTTGRRLALASRIVPSGQQTLSR